MEGAGPGGASCFLHSQHPSPPPLSQPQEAPRGEFSLSLPRIKFTLMGGA